MTERLTVKAPSGLIHLKDASESGVNQAIKKLAEYETAEEEGRLVLLPAPLKDVDTFGKVDGSYWARIPFRIGDTFYRIVTNIHTKRKSIEEAIVSRIAITNSEIQIFSDNICGKGVFGRTAFVTSEESEKSLKEMNKNE